MLSGLAWTMSFRFFALNMLHITKFFLSLDSNLFSPSLRLGCFLLRLQPASPMAKTQTDT